jgi:hypothetical protein
MSLRTTPPIDISAALTIKGWMNPRELRWLAEHAQTAQTIIEIGSFLGRFTRALADHCRGTVFAIDSWDEYRNDDGSQAEWITKVGGAWWAIRDGFKKNLAPHLTSRKVIPSPCISTMCRAIERPRPVPPPERARSAL